MPKTKDKQIEEDGKTKAIMYLKERHDINYTSTPQMFSFNTEVEIAKAIDIAISTIDKALTLKNKEVEELKKKIKKLEKKQFKLRLIFEADDFPDVNKNPTRREDGTFMETTT